MTKSKEKPINIADLYRNWEKDGGQKPSVFIPFCNQDEWDGPMVEMFAKFCYEWGLKSRKSVMPIYKFYQKQIENLKSSLLSSRVKPDYNTTVTFKGKKTSVLLIPKSDFDRIFNDTLEGSDGEDK